MSGAGAQVDQAASPTVKFTSKPSTRSHGSSAIFAFTVTDPVSTLNDMGVQHELDGGSPQSALSPLTLIRLGKGSHTLTILVTDQAGNTAQVTYRWTIS